MRYLLLIIFIFFAQLSFGQYQELFNQSIQVLDADRLEVSLKGNVTYQEWEGTFVLVETKVVIENCNDNVFKAFVKEGRYKIQNSINGNSVKLVSHKNLGRVVKTKLGETKETVYFKIYFPEGFKDHQGIPLTSTIIHEQVDPEENNDKDEDRH